MMIFLECREIMKLNEAEPLCKAGDLTMASPSGSIKPCASRRALSVRCCKHQYERVLLPPAADECGCPTA